VSGRCVIPYTRIGTWRVGLERACDDGRVRITITGATGLIGNKLVAALRERGDEITVLSRDPEKAKNSLAGVDAVAWRDPESEPAPVAALAGRDAVVHLAGEPVAQRWSASVKDRIRSSRELGTRNLVEAMNAASPSPGVLVSSSAVGYYGPHGDEELDETSPPGTDFLSEVCVVWEQEAQKADARVVLVRTGIVLAESGGALATMLPFFKAGVGGPVAGGKQYMPWIHLDDLVGIYVRALDDAAWEGPVNGSAPEPVTNKAFSKTLGSVLRRPAFAPVPKFAIRTLFGEMADVVANGQRAVPRRTQELGYKFEYTALEPALRSALAR
jgi:uncharacterized protein (TIGR01777 family)